jgi:hypothetical protein
MVSDFGLQKSTFQKSEKIILSFLYEKRLKNI